MASYCFKLSWKWLINIIKSTMGCIFYNPCLFLAIKGAVRCPLWRTQKHLLYLQLSEITAVGVFCFTTNRDSNEPLLCWYYKNKAGIIITCLQETVGDRPAAATNCSLARKLLLVSCKLLQQHLLEVRPGTGRNINMLHDWRHWRRPRILTAVPCW